MMANCWQPHAKPRPPTQWLEETVGEALYWCFVLSVYFMLFSCLHHRQTDQPPRQCREGGDLVGEPFTVDDMRIEVVGDPLLEFGVAFVLHRSTSRSWPSTRQFDVGEQNVGMRGGGEVEPALADQLLGFRAVELGICVVDEGERRIRQCGS